MNDRDQTIILDHHVTRIRSDAERVVALATAKTVDRSSLRRAYATLFEAADILNRVERDL